MFQTKLALIIIILFINFNILQICTPLVLPAINILYIINKYFHSYGKHFVSTGIFYHDLIAVIKNTGGFSCLLALETTDTFSLNHNHGWMFILYDRVVH